MRQRGHVRVALDHRGASGEVLRRLAAPSAGGLGERRIPVLLYALVWRIVGPCPVGYAGGDIPIVTARKGSCAVDVLELAE